MFSTIFITKYKNKKLSKFKYSDRILIKIFYYYKTIYKVFQEISIRKEPNIRIQLDQSMQPI